MKLGSKWALLTLDMAVFSDLERLELTIVRDQALGLNASIREMGRYVAACMETIEGHQGLRVLATGRQFILALCCG